MLSKISSLEMIMTLMIIMMIMIMIMSSTSAGNFSTDCEIIWGPAKILQRGKTLNLKLDNTSGSAFESKLTYLFGQFDIQAKLVPNNSAGTVTTFYLTSSGDYHDEIDIEFLGNTTGEPYTLHTNIYANGTGGREQQFKLWYDPTLNYHKYSIVWDITRIIFLVDNIAIRVFNNNELKGIPFPTSQPMRLISSIWNADNWATQGGRIKTNWSDAPFQASFKNLNINGHACVDGALCSSTIFTYSLNSAAKKRLTKIDSEYMIYDYCKDLPRYQNSTFPPECKLPMFP